METHTIILWVLAAVELVIIVSIFLRYQRTPSIYSLCGLLLGFSLMSFFVGMLMIEISNEARIWIAKAAFFSGGISFISLYAFAIHYPLRTFLKHNFIRFSILVPLILLIPFIFFVPGFLDDIVVQEGNIDIVTGNLFWIFVLFTAVYCLAAIAILIIKIAHTSGEQKKQVGLITLIIGCSGILAVITNQLLPVIGVPFNKVYGPESAGIVSIVIALIAMKK